MIHAYFLWVFGLPPGRIFFQYLIEGEAMKVILFKALLGVCFLLGAEANAALATISATDGKYITIDADGNVYGAFSAANYAGAPTYSGLFVGKIDHIQGGQRNLGVEGRALYEFNLSTLGQASIASASFSFMPNDPALGISGCFDLVGCPAISSLDVLGYSGDGVVNGSDVNAGALLGQVNPIPAFGTPVAVDVTTFIAGLLNAHRQFAGFNLQAASFNGGLRVTDGLLTISYDAAPVPLPSAIYLFGFGLSLMGLNGKFKR